MGTKNAASYADYKFEEKVKKKGTKNLICKNNFFASFLNKFVTIGALFQNFLDLKLA